VFGGPAAVRRRTHHQGQGRVVHRGTARAPRARPDARRGEARSGGAVAMTNLVGTDSPLGAATREAFGDELVALGKEHPEIVVVDGDVNNSTYTNKFMKEFPERFFNCGIAESNMIGVAAGLASCGKVAFVSSFSAFLINNAYEQLRMSVAYPHLNVKCVGTHAGISIGEDGPSQMALEDVAATRALAGFVVLV